VTRATASQDALVTIISANYLPFARVLCRSFAEHEPLVRRFVVIVDEGIDEVVTENEPFEVLHVRAIGIPDLDDFLAQYTVLEANTAVKPFVLRFLFERYGFERVVYLDPDIWVHSRLDAVWAALDKGSVVLTPHLRDAFRDEGKPAEIDILRSGTYNLGFIALRRSVATEQLLEWWTQKTQFDCVVDLESGLFVDQKWMDLVPGYCDGTVILRHPGYNVAYWNLHERELTFERGRYGVGSEPLAFFHFSGYDPDRPDVLSKHQDRHDLRSMPVVRRLCDAYAERLLAEGYSVAKRRSYAFGTLANGIPVSRLIRKTVRHCRKQGIAFPPVHHADDFCRFLMTPNAEIAGADISPFSEYVLRQRHDVIRTHPRARADADDVGFLGWLQNSSHELEDEALYRRFSSCLIRVNPFARIRRVYERRSDLQAAFPDAFQTLPGLEPFGAWLTDHGRREEAFSLDEVEAFIESGRSGFTRVLDFYLTKPDVAREFPSGLLPWANAAFLEFLLQNGMRLARISATDIRWFQCRADCVEPSTLLLLTALRSHWLRSRLPLGATVAGWKDLCSWAAEARTAGSPSPSLPDDPPNRVSGVAQLEIIHAASLERERHSAALRTRVGARRLADAVLKSIAKVVTEAQQARLERAIETYTPSRGVNVAGHFHYSGGVGSAADSIARALDAVGIAHRDIALPVCPSRMSARNEGNELVPDRYWTLHRPDFEVAITVANADVMPAAHAYLGPCYDRGRRHVAYWVWETDRLPGRYASAAANVDTIWTPSEYSARALRATLGDSRPIEVLPYAISVAPAVDPRPLPVALPEGRTLFGFFFDARSVIERKNPMAVLRAFRKAFRGDDPVALLLKVNHAAEAPHEMAELERAAEGLPVVWLRDVRQDESQVRILLGRLDVYVALHRAEGFGLVLAEAMSLGRPVIATRYSGNLEFMDDSCARLVDSREIATERSYGPYPRGTRWGEPDIDQAAEAMRALFRDADARATLGTRARARIEQDLSPWVVGARLEALLGWRSAPSGQPAQRSNGANGSAHRDMPGATDPQTSSASGKSLSWSVE
jgi:glycosyltransferase involved in cell wall biosynthesis